jgi:molybdopterin converting factor small subunit
VRVLVRLHALAAEAAGAPEAVVEVAEGASCADVKRALAADHPALAGLLRSAALATDAEYLRDSAPAADPLHLVPPVSGG